ncbi:BadF/BadG/BcrA/BcrD ATPase family protein [Streptomyces sp. NPDC102406]|uniref:BadF/BadG/BcrA/BcrD ATPase family protein n=1 Tax=Streptomyces sp. NPDC102406 TaxID=3366171 RepID=UPI003819D421
MLTESIDRYAAPLAVGVDAGGTRVRARCVDADGRTVGVGHGGPGNALSVERPTLVRHLEQALEAAVPLGLRGAVAGVVGGFAGAGQGGGSARGRGVAEECLAEALARLGVAAALRVYGDVEVACAAGPGAPADGLVLVAGTGAAAARVAGRRTVRVVDGDGWLLGDTGSGFWLGRQALRGALRAVDGRAQWGPLVTLVLDRVVPGQADPGLDWAARHRLKQAIAAWAYTRRPVALAELSPLVVSAAQMGDTGARSLLDAAAGQLRDSVRALEPSPGESLVITGGLLGPGGPLEDRLRTAVEPMGLRCAAVPDGVGGAVALARLLIAESAEMP